MHYQKNKPECVKYLDTIKKLGQLERLVRP